MYTEILSIALIAGFLFGPSEPVLPATTALAQITFITPASREQSSNQQTLPPEKKKTLANIGPDEIFPGENEAGAKQEKAPPQGKESKPARGKSSKPEARNQPVEPSESPVPEQATNPAAARSTPAPLPPAESLAAAAAPPAMAHSTPHWQIAGLAVLSFIVLIGLIAVLLKLRQLFHEEKEENA